MGQSQGSEFLRPLCTAYANLMRRQRTAASAFVRWSQSARRSHEFCWLNGNREGLLFSGEAITISPADAAFASVHKMMATLELNPYERDAHYGYPYVVGRIGDKGIRAPLFTISVSIESQGKGLCVTPTEEALRFNSLAFRSDSDAEATTRALARLIEETPELPLSSSALQEFCRRLIVELSNLDVHCEAQLTGALKSAPKEPRGKTPLSIVDNAAIFIAPKTGYFVVSDLERIGEEGELEDEAPLGVLLGRKQDRPTSDAFEDDRSVNYPFSSNRSQRRVARILDDDTNKLVVVQGPPGTGKSLTISNLACHLVAKGKRVLVTSQRDKALEVVDEQLRRLNLAQLPMTLLRNDRESKQELRARLDSIQKRRPAAEAESLRKQQEIRFAKSVSELMEHEKHLGAALLCDHLYAEEERRLRAETRALRRMSARPRAWMRKSGANRRAPWLSNEVALAANKQRQRLLDEAVEILGSAAEDRVSQASRNQRNQLREFSRLLGRNQSAHKNFSIFDRLKNEPDRCDMLLSILPCWIMTPDDAARLFPCEPGIFDVVIIDEASQCDLPSITPVLYRAKQVVVAGDSRQMQARRFAFTSEQVARQAWVEQGLSRHDPGLLLDPAKTDLLQLATVRSDDEVLLDEHFRSLPPIIQFSNQRWYNSQLRIMRDLCHRRHGDVGRAVIHMTRVEGGRVEEGTQENQVEAEALVAALHQHMGDPGFADATFGVICLFEEQMRLVTDLVSEEIPEELRLRHRLTVVNPDGFQGDERDVIYYSLSYDAEGMTKSQLAARQAEHDHIQGMLNVAFTRARDEVHVFHSASLSDFAKASGQGTIRDWLEYCASHQERTQGELERELARADSEFEAEVMRALSQLGAGVTSQYPSCGFRIDIVAELNGDRLAIECDGELYHLDEHGELRREDVERQEILERAGWRVTRIPYRRWLKDPEAEAMRVFGELSGMTVDGSDDGNGKTSATRKAKTPSLSPFEAAVVKSIQEGNHAREDVLKTARGHLGYQRLGKTVKAQLDAAISNLVGRNLLFIEERELYLAQDADEAAVTVNYERPQYSTPYRPYRSYGRSRYRRSYHR